MDDDTWRTLLETFVETSQRITNLEIKDGVHVVQVSLPSHGEHAHAIQLPVSIAFDEQLEVIHFHCPLNVYVAEGTKEQYQEELAAMQELGFVDGLSVLVGEISCTDDEKGWHYGLSGTTPFPISHAALGSTAVQTALLHASLELFLYGVGKYHLYILDAITNEDDSKAPSTTRLN
jgi:hypothetical protein